MVAPGSLERCEPSIGGKKNPRECRGFDDLNKKESTQARSLDEWKVDLASGTGVPGVGGTRAYGSRLELALPRDLRGGIEFSLLRRMQMFRNHALPLDIASFRLGE